MKKKFLALILTLCMVLTLVPVSAFAASGDPSAAPQAAAAEEPVRATKTGTVLAFTSDTHNKGQTTNNNSVTRLGTWIDKMTQLYGGIDAMAFGGDMANASASSTDYWTFTKEDMQQLSSRGVTGVYTTGNHEHDPGRYSSSSTDEYMRQYKINAEGAVGDDYRIYCLGSMSSSSTYANSITPLTNYLNSVGNDKVIFIITHFPLHYYTGRTTAGAEDVINVLNDAVAGGKKIVFLWGHNHTMSDTYYDYIYKPGDTIEIPDPSSSSSWWPSSTIDKTIQFYYGAAGCMSDSEYGSGSASVKGKGLVVTIDDQKNLTFTYHNADGADVTEGGSFTEQEVAVTGVTINPATASVKAGGTITLTATVSPATATNKAVTWASSNTSVATVSNNGVVTGRAVGNATITATTVDGGKTATCAVSVVENTSSTVTYALADALEDGNNYLIANGKTGSVYVLTTEANGSRTLKGLSATVTDGKITLDQEDAEKAVFTAELKNSASGSVSAWLSNDGKYLYTNNANGLRMVEASEQGNTDNTAKVWHYKADNKNLLWYFKDTSSTDGYTDTSSTYKYFLECNNGNFTDNHASTTSLANTNTPAMYLFAEYDSTPIAVTGVQLNQSSMTLSVGKSGTLTATVLPEKAANKNVTWVSSDTSVATVSSTGVVTAKAVGNAVITVTTEDGGKTASCNVTVSTVVTKNYVLTDTFEDGKDYLIANGDNGNVYLVSTEANGSRTLKGVQATVVDDVITLTEEEAEKVAFTVELKDSASGSVSAWLTNDGKYLYTNNADGLRMVEASEQGSTDNTAKVWHYKADGKDLLWYFKDTSSTDGYTDTSSTYKYFLECNNGNFTDNHASTTSLANTSTPKMYIYVDSEVTPDTTVDYVLTDAFKDGGEYLIANAKTGSAYILSTTANGSRTLKGIAVNVVDGKITVSGSTARKAAFTAELKNSASGSVSAWLSNGGKYLYTNNADGLRMVEASEQGSTDNTAKVWHYKADGKDLLWYFKDTSSTDGYTDTSQTYKYFLECNNGNFTDNHASTTSLANTNTPAMYLFEKSAHVHTYGEPEWIWSVGRRTRAAISATAVFTCEECGETESVTAEVTQSEENGKTVYTATAQRPDGGTVTAVRSLYQIIFTADKTNVSAGDTVTFTISLSAVEGFGSFEMDLAIGEGLVYDTGSFAPVDGLEDTLGFDTVSFNPDNLRFNGYGVRDYSSDEKTDLATFTCTVTEEIDKSANVGLSYLEVGCNADWSDYTEFYEVVIATVSNHDHVAGTAVYEWTGNDEDGYTAVKGYIPCTVEGCGHEIVSETVTPTYAETTPATCEAAGVGTWTADFTKEGLTDQTKTVDIPALGHDWEFADFTWTGSDADGYTAAVANYVCGNDATHKQTVTGTVTSAEGEGENAGYTVYTAAVAAADSLDGEAHSFEKRTPIKYTITYDLAGGTVATANPTTYTVESNAITLNNPTKDGYVFAGWTGTGLDAATETVTIAKGSTGNRTYTATWEEGALAISYVMSNNITFEGALTFNAYTVITDEVLADEGAYMLITYTKAPTPTTATTVTDKVLVKDAVVNTQTSSGIVRRVFTNPFFIAQLHDEVTMRLYSGDDELLPLGRSVGGEIIDMTETGVVDTPWAYLDRIIDNPNSRPAMVDLAKMTKIYGTAAQLHFGYHTDLIPAGAEAALDEAISGNSITEALGDYKEWTSGTLPAGISRFTKQVVYEDDHSLKYFFYLDGSVDISKYTFWIDSGDNTGYHEVAAVKVADGKYSVQQPNIPSGYLSKTYKFKVSDGTNTYEITSSGFAYANAIVTKNSNPTMVKLVKAMYLYGIAAEKNFGITNN